MSQNIITLADLIENVKLGGGSVITSITEQEPAAGPHASVAPPSSSMVREATASLSLHSKPATS